MGELQFELFDVVIDLGLVEEETAGCGIEAEKAPANFAIEENVGDFVV